MELAVSFFRMPDVKMADIILFIWAIPIGVTIIMCIHISSHENTLLAISLLFATSFALVYCSSPGQLYSSCGT